MLYARCQTDEDYDSCAIALCICAVQLHIFDITSPHDAMLVRYMPSSCVCLSVTSRHSTKMAKHRITQTAPYDSPGTSFLMRQRSWRNSNGVTPNGGAK